MKKNKIIGIDLDEVLSELINYILKFYDYKIGNINIKRQLITDYYLHKIPGLNLSKIDAVNWFIKGIKSDINQMKIKPVLGAKEKLEDLKKNGFKLLIVTARPKRIEKYTFDWIEKYYPNLFNDIYFAEHFTKNHKEKSEICKDLSITNFIEDNFDYALDLANSGVNTFLLEKPWNIAINNNHSKIIKIKSWENFDKKLII